MLVISLYHCALSAHIVITGLYIKDIMVLNQGWHLRQMSNETGWPKRLFSASQKVDKPCITKWSAPGIVCSNIFSVTYCAVCVCAHVCDQTLKCFSISAVMISYSPTWLRVCLNDYWKPFYLFFYNGFFLFTNTPHTKKCCSSVLQVIPHWFSDIQCRDASPGSAINNWHTHSSLSCILFWILLGEEVWYCMCFQGCTALF